MSNLNILVIGLFLLIACSNPNSKTNNKETPTDTVTVEQHNLAEPSLALGTTSNQENEEGLGITEQPATFDSTGRPSRPILRNLKVDTTQLFGVWADKHSYPNAAFSIDSDEYYIADFEGDPIVSYILDGDSLTLFFEWGKETSRISLPNPNLLIMARPDGETYKYERFHD